MRKRQNRLFHFIALSFVFLGLSTAMMAQQELSGSVSDENGDPIIGASITVNNSSSGTITDAMGQYTLKLYDDQTTVT